MRRASALVLLALALAGCGDDAQPPEEAQRSEDAPVAAEERRETRLPPRLRCPSDAANCRSARGTIVYVERVDPDGDGDAHFVLQSREGVTGPGITVIDVAKRLRPDPLPEAGDTVSAAGPVYRGSYGQRQIEAKRLRVRRR